MDTFISSIEEIGRKEGRKEGQQELLIRLLERKLGTLPTDLATQIATLSSARVLALSDVLFDFQTTSDVTYWLNQEHKAGDGSTAELA